MDLIAEQIRTALGDPLGYTQEDITFHGVGVEYRIIAEDPDSGFAPWVGNIEKFEWQAEDWCSLHTHVPAVSPVKPYTIPTEFDPNLALGIIWGRDLAEVTANGLDFLENLTLEGRNGKGEALKSNVDFLKRKTERMLRF